MRIGSLALASRLLPVALLAVVSAACSTRGYPALNGPRQLFANGEIFDDHAIAQALATTTNLPPRPRLAVVLLDGDAAGEPLDGSVREQVLEELRARLDRPPIASVSIVPTITAGAFSTDGVPSLAELRTAAARQRADVLILATLAANDYRGVNPLAMTYFAILPMFVVPGSEVATYASAEACALDVRSGLILGCRSGRGEAGTGFVAMIGMESAAREASADAARQALEPLPTALRATIEAALPGDDTAAYADY